jgi:hypothetical protein
MTTEYAWKSLQLISEWIKVADVKAGALLAANGVFVGFAMSGALRLGSLRVAPVNAVLASLALVCAVASTVLAVRALNPRVDVGGPPSLLYFDSIASRHGDDREKFVQSYVNLTADPARLTRQLADQIWATSVVTRYKYRYIRWATGLFVAGLGFGAAAGLARVFAV